MHRFSISEFTTFRWDLDEEVAALARHRFDAIALWRTKLSDHGSEAVRARVERAAVRISSLQWAGGFTGGDGRTFRESIDDAREAIETAAHVGTAVLVVHPGCRGGHTLGHAHRLLGEALERLAPFAAERGVRLALQPFHPAAAAGAGFLTRLSQALEWVDRFDHPAVALALDLWHFGHDPALPGLLPDLVRRLAVVKVADRSGPPSPAGERLPPGFGSLPLGTLVSGLAALGYRGDFEFELVGEAVESAGYQRTLRHLRQVADSWTTGIPAPAVRDHAPRPRAPARG